MLKIAKISADVYEIQDGKDKIRFSKEKFEDLYYAVPLNVSHFLRLLQDEICSQASERHTLNGMLKNIEKREEILLDLQKQIQDMVYP